MTRKAGIACAGIALLAAGIYVAVFIFAGRTRNIENILGRYQFTALIPPSTLAPPGTIVTVLKQPPLVIGVVCTPTEALGDQLQPGLLISDSSSSKEAEELTGRFHLTGGSKQQLAGALDSRYVRSIELTLSEVKLMEIPDSLVFQLVGQRKDNCSRAIEFRERNGQKISMIKAVIQANALYTVEFEGSLDATTRERISREIASGMGLRVSEGSEDTIRGDGLYWGVRDDSSLATVSGNRPPPTGATQHVRILPSDNSARVVVDGRELK